MFALGSPATYAAIGEIPFGTGVDTGVLYRAVYKSPSLTGVCDILRELVAACLIRSPARRPALTTVIQECRGQSGATSLKITSGWLPPAHAEEIRRWVAVTALIRAGVVTPRRHAPPPDKRWGGRLLRRVIHSGRAKADVDCETTDVVVGSTIA